MKSLFEPHIGVVGKVLDMQLERQNVVASNLANVQTPGYRAQRLDFEKELQKALGLDAQGKMARTDPRHMPTAFDPNGFNVDSISEVRPRVIHGEDRVNLDKEMATMAKTNLNYVALTSVMRSNFDGLKTIISEGQK